MILRQALMRIEGEVKLDFKDVLIRPKRSTLRSRSEVDLVRTFKMRNSGREWSGIPVTVANMLTTGTFEVAKVMAVQKCMTAIHKHYTVEEWKEFAASNKEVLPYVGASAGIGAADSELLDAVLTAVPEISTIVLDVANGYSEAFVEAVREARRKYPTHNIWAGNVVTGEMVEELILAGADVIKIGIGPGSVCTTRRVTGVGYPQLSAIIECADAAHGLGGLVCADGGISVPGDAAKAFGAGADFIMAGGMFAGHDESGGEVVEVNGRKVKLFYGMSSATAMKKTAGGAVAEYRASEGKTVQVPYKGPLAPTLLQLLGGLRSACTYVGAARLKEISKRTTFIRVTQQLNPKFADLPDIGSHGYTSETVAAASGGGASEPH